MWWNRKSIRLQWYDYRSAWSYFVTLCCNEMRHCFWVIQNGEMVLNQLWNHVWKCRKEIPIHYPFVSVWEFMCMPNHIHGIINIWINEGAKYFSPVHMYKNKWMPQWAKSWSLGAIVRWFKIWVTKFATLQWLNFKWQRNYYESIIKDKRWYENIVKYIRNNPKNRNKKRN